MTVEQLASLILKLALQFAPPGQSPYSVVAVPECTAPAACDAPAPCDEPLLACRPPRWSPSRQAWVRLEQEEEGRRRYAVVADALASTAFEVHSAWRRDDRGHAWPGTVEELALATLTVALHESGLRRDVQIGDRATGRGPAGEVCLVQLDVKQAPRFASWLSDEERASLAERSAARDAFADTLVGEEPAALGRCFSVGMHMLARARHACDRAGDHWAFGMFSLYGSGASCRVPTLRNRFDTFKKLVEVSAVRRASAAAALRM